MILIILSHVLVTSCPDVQSNFKIFSPEMNTHTIKPSAPWHWKETNMWKHKEKHIEKFIFKFLGEEI